MQTQTFGRCGKIGKCKQVTNHAPAKIAKTEHIIDDNVALDKLFDKLKTRRFEKSVLFSCLTISVSQNGQENAM
jgi:hypothetical protein